MNKKTLLLSIALAVGVSLSVGIQFSLADDTSSTDTNISGTVTLVGANEDKVFKWAGDDALHTPDWKWSVSLSNSSSTVKTIKRMVVVHNTAGEGWATDDSANNPVNKSLYLLGTTHSQSADASVFNMYTGNLGFTLNPNSTTNFYAYGATWLASQRFSGGYLTVYFTDDTSAKITIPASDLVPGTVPATTQPVITNTTEKQIFDVTPGSPIAAIMSVNTDRSATCKYSTTANASYDSLSSIFNTTGGTTHRTYIGRSGDSTIQSTTYYVRCKDTSGNANTTDFAIIFTFNSSSAQPSITVLSPNGGEAWAQGSTQKITWTTTNIPALNNMTVRLRDSAGVEHYFYSGDLANVVSNNGFFSITIPSTLAAGSYKAEVKTSVGSQSYLDVSDNYFTITAPSAAKISISQTTGAQDAYTAGQNIKIGVKGVKPDGTLTVPAEGFNLQAYIYDSARTKTYQGINGEYDSASGFWYANLIAPTNSAISYDLQLVVYCAYDNLSCKEYGLGYYDQAIKVLKFKVSAVSAQTSITVSNAQSVPSQTISVGAENQALGSFTTTVANEPISVKNMVFVLFAKPVNTPSVTGIRLVDENGVTVAGPVDARATTDSGFGDYLNLQKFIITGPVTFPIGTHNFTIKGTLPAAFAGNEPIKVLTNPSAGWTNAVGIVSGKTVDVSGLGVFNMNPMAIVTSSVPGLTCDALKSKQAYYFNVCSTSGAGYDNVCFDKYSGAYQGCTNNSNNDCTLRNVNASKNLLCPVTAQSSFASSVKLISANEDKAPKWNNSGYIHAPDWKWAINIVNPSSVAKNVKRMVLVHNTGGEGWATDVSANNPLGKSLYTLAITASQSADAEVYTQQTDALLPLWTISGNGGTKSFYAYGYPASQRFTGGYLMVYYTDDTSDKITIPASDLVPGMGQSAASQRSVASDMQISQITTNANLLGNDKMSQILAELQLLRDTIKEQQTQIKYLNSLLKDVSALSQKTQDALTNFITYGVDANTQRLGAGERAAVINSYKAAFDKLPETEAELADAIKIANGRFPSVTSADAENAAKEQFVKIYKREADLNNANDNAAIKVMAYGLRQKAENRNLNSEKAGIKIFKNIFGSVPTTTQDWNTMQAITYSGATR